VKSPDLKGQISDKQQEIKTLADEIAQLKAARVDLEKLGRTNLESYSQNLMVISLLWTAAKNDAIKVKEWLEQGAEDAVRPQFTRSARGIVVRLEIDQRRIGYAGIYAHLGKQRCHDL